MLQLCSVRALHRSRPGSIVTCFTCSRRHVYVLDDDAWHDTMVNNTRLYAPMTDALDRAIDRIAADAPERHRLELTREFLLFVTREMQLLAERWERHKRTLRRGRD